MFPANHSQHFKCEKGTSTISSSRILHPFMPWEITQSIMYSDYTYPLISIEKYRILTMSVECRLLNTYNQPKTKHINKTDKQTSKQQTNKWKATACIRKTILLQCRISNRQAISFNNIVLHSWFSAAYSLPQQVIC